MKWKAHCVLVQTVWTLPHTLFCFPFSFCILSVSFQSLLCVAVFGWTFHTCGMPCLGSPICSFPAFELLSYFCILQASSFFLLVLWLLFLVSFVRHLSSLHAFTSMCERVKVVSVNCIFPGPCGVIEKLAEWPVSWFCFFVCQDGLIACVM